MFVVFFAGGSSHPLDRSSGSSGGSGGAGPIRHDRRRGGGGGGRERDDRPRSYGYDGRDAGDQWARGAALLPAPAAASLTKLVGDTVRLSNLARDTNEEDLRYIFDKVSESAMDVAVSNAWPRAHGFDLEMALTVHCCFLCVPL